MNPVSLLRTAWRQLTSMRTALVLLFLLAMAALPGALLPQRSLNQRLVDQYVADHPTLAPWQREVMLDVARGCGEGRASGRLPLPGAGPSPANVSADDGS